MNLPCYFVNQGGIKVFWFGSIALAVIMEVAIIFAVLVAIAIAGAVLVVTVANNSSISNKLSYL